MNSFKRAIINIKRQPAKSGVLLALTFILGVVLSAAISVRTAIVATEENVMMRVPAISTIHLDYVSATNELGRDANIWRSNRPTIYDISAVGQLPYVRAYDFYLGVSLFSRDLEWATFQVDKSKIRGLSEAEIEQEISGLRSWSENAAEVFDVRGVNNPAITDIEAGLLSLATGRTFYPEEIENGELVAVVSQNFATLNNLYIGSMMSISSAVHSNIAMVDEGVFAFSEGWLDERFMIYHEILEFEIIGILNVEHELNYENYYGWDPSRQLQDLALRDLAELHNRIYIPVTVADTILRTEHEESLELYAQKRELWPHESFPEDDDELLIQSIFLLYDPRDLEVFTEAAKPLLPDFWSVADVSGAFYNIIASMDTMLEIADLILWLTIGVMIITLTLIITLFLRDRRREIGIYMALGDKKFKILAQFLTEIFLVAAIGIAFALFTGNILSSAISRNMLEQTLIERAEESNENEGPILWELTIFNPDEIPLEEVLEMYDTSLDIRTIGIFVGVSVAVILISTIAPIMQIVRLEPKMALLD